MALPGFISIMAIPPPSEQPWVQTGQPITGVVNDDGHEIPNTDEALDLKKKIDGDYKTDLLIEYAHQRTNSDLKQFESIIWIMVIAFVLGMFVVRYLLGLKSGQWIRDMPWWFFYPISGLLAWAMTRPLKRYVFNDDNRVAKEEDIEKAAAVVIKKRKAKDQKLTQERIDLRNALASRVKERK